MSNFDKAIEIIMAEPPEPRYPEYYASLLRQADVPGKDVGNCSETPNSSETIYRQAAIDAINCDITVTGRQNAEVVAATIGAFVDRIKALPPAEPEVTEEAVKEYCRKRCLCIVDSALLKKYASTEPKISLLTVKVAPDLEELERTVRKIKDTSVMILPPAEPERKKGKWIVDALANNVWHCSECGTDAPVEPTGGTEYKSNYCPYCGLDMRGETDED